MRMIPGGFYRAVVDVGHFWASDATVREKLLAAGFAAVRVWDDGDVRRVEGIWTGKDEDDPIPPHLREVVLVK